jgi:outer membrane receptor protein involved in Fe transport
VPGCASLKTRSSALGQASLSLNLACIALLFGAGLAWSQVGSHVVEGTVRDPSGALLPGARVIVQSKSYKHSATTSAEGNFSFLGVPEEAITLTIEASGFSLFQRSFPGEQTRIDVVLTLAPVAQESTVTANRFAINLNDTAESVRVLPRQAFDVTPGDPVDVVLRQVPGFALFRRSDSREANPTSQGASLRGIGASGASRAVVLHEGAPLNDPFGGWVYWGRVPGQSVGSVEVLRGGASSLYGGAALGGVINILPRRLDRNLFSSEVSMATQGTPDVSAVDSFKADAWQLANSAEIFRTAGYILVPANLRGTVDTPADSSHQALETELTRALHSGDLWTSLSFYNEARDNGTRVQTNNTQLWQIVAGTDFATRFGSFQLRGYGGGESFNQTFSSVAADRNSEALVNAQHVPSQNVGASLLWTGNFKRNVLVAGADAANVEGLSEDLGFVASRPRAQVNSGGRQLSSGTFVQDMVRLTSRLLLTAGGRYDNWNNYDAQSQTVPFVSTVQPGLVHFVEHSEHAFTPRAALLFNASSRLTLTASGYTAFRPPTLNELYRTFRLGNTVTQANAQLVAERLSGGEAGANLLLARARIHAAFFWMQVADPIANVTLSVTPSLTTNQRQNLGRTRSRGVETDMQWRFRRIDLRAGYQFVDAVVAAFPANRQLVGLQLPQIAPHQFTAQATYASQRWTAALLARATSAQFEDDLNRLSLDPFFQLDGYVARRLHNNVEIFAGVENLTAQRVVIARTPLVNLGPPITGKVGLKFQFE